MKREPGPRVEPPETPEVTRIFEHLRELVCADKQKREAEAAILDHHREQRTPG